LLDQDASALLAICKDKRFDSDSVIIVKDNVVDEEKERDSDGVYRTQAQWEALFKEAGLRISKQ
jgi:hypothetical protein